MYKKVAVDNEAWPDGKLLWPLLIKESKDSFPIFLQSGLTPGNEFEKDPFVMWDINSSSLQPKHLKIE